MVCRAAQITPGGTAGIAVIEIVGSKAPVILQQVFSPADASIGTADRVNYSDFTPEADRLYRGKIHEQDGEIIDEAIVFLHRDRNSAEIHCHGGGRIIQRILLLLARSGVEITTWEELAQPRSLAEEAAYMLAFARTRLAVKALAAQHTGGLNRWINETATAILNGGMTRTKLTNAVTGLLESYEISQKLLIPTTVVICGPVNAGKSTLANVLAGKTQSLTSSLPGTTRDWTGQVVDIDGFPIELIDTAGYHNAMDGLEKQSLASAKGKIAHARILLYVRDASIPAEEKPHAMADRYLELTGKQPETSIIKIANKCDLLKADLPGGGELPVSALTGYGIGELRKNITTALGVDEFNPLEPLVFTPRQFGILQDILKKPDPDSQENRKDVRSAWLKYLNRLQNGKR